MEVYIILFTLRLWVPVYTFISFISYSSLIFHRSISFDLVTVEFLFLFFHGGISLSIVTKKEKIQYIVIEMSFVRANPFVWSVASRTFYRQILSLLYRSFSLLKLPPPACPGTTCIIYYIKIIKCIYINYKMSMSPP